MRKPVLWLVLLGSLLVARDLKASFYTVTGTADNTDNVIHGGSGTAGDPFQMSSLRGAILDANANTGPHTISLPPGTYTVSGELPAIVTDLNLTLQGGTLNPADTVLNQTQATQRFLETDFVDNLTPNNVVLTFANLTFTNGQAAALGGGVLLVGGLGSITTVSNCVFLNNSTSASGQPGGVIESSPDGDVIVQSCVFQGNASADSGGAIDFLSQTEENPGHGNLTVTGSSFIGNSSAVNGGAINVNSVIGAQTITLCNFTGNTATTAGVNAANGGAIAHYSGTMAAHYNRFFNNTAATAANGNTLYQAGEAPGTFSFDATDNWWGANSGPGADDILAGSAVGSGTWLQLEITPGVPNLSPGGSTSLTADLLNRNAGGLLPPNQLVGLPAVPDPTILFHNPVLGTLSGASAQFINGVAAATFTAGAAGGIASAQVTLDNQTMTATMLIPTSVSSISRVTATPSNLGSVQWTVTFFDAVSGVSAANFSLVNSGLGGTPTVTDASPVGAQPTATWTVTASTGTGTGTLGLNMVNATGVSVPVNNLAFVGDVYDIDKTPPTVTSVSATVPDGSYTAGALITITVSFTKPVLVTGTPQLALNSGASAFANYASGSGTTTLTFIYLVGPAEDSPHLDYSSASALTLNGGTLADTVGNNATLTLPNPGAPGSLSANNIILIQASTTTAVISSPNPSVLGQPATFSALITSPGPGTPTGTAQFVVDGSNSGPPVALVAGVASFTTSILPVGTHAISAVYSGDVVFLPSASSPPYSHVVNKAATTTTVAPSPNPSVFGQPVTLTATASVVAPGAGTPTGTASFFDGATLLGTVTLNVAGQASITTSTLTVGTHSITAVYSGDANFTAGTSSVASTTVNQAATVTTVTSLPNPSVFGQAVTLTATASAVSPGAGTPTGTASFFDGATLLGTGTLNAVGQATFTTSTLAVGTRSITAVYGGDANFAGSTSAVASPTVNQAATTTTVTAAPNLSVFGQAVTLTATASAVSPGAGTPTGTASFFDGATLLGTGTLNASGQASFTTSTLSVGTHSITTVYAGDADFTGSTSPVVSPVVNKAATTTTVVSSPNPSVIGQPVTLTATASAVAPGAGTPTGTASFFDGATLLGTVTLNAAGQAAFTTTTLALGTHSITTVYAGDASFTGSTSPAVSPVVNKAATATTVASLPNPSVFGQPVTLTATASVVAPGAGTPTGTASFFDGATLLGTGTLNAAGQASFTTSTLAAGNHSITAVYSGDANFTGNTSPVTSPVVNQAATTTTVASSPNPSVFGQPVTLTATASVVAPGAGTPTGTASFFDGATLLGTGTLNAAGQATFTTSTLAVGTRSITAVYGGDANFAGSTSAVASPVVNKAATTTTVTSLPNPSVFGQAMILTATASVVAPGAGTPTGTASFFDGATLLGTGTLNASGKASFTTSTLSVGTHSITVVYSGDADFTGSTSPAVSPVVNKAATTTTVVSSPNPSVFGQPVTLTATASAVAPGAGTPTGTANFFDGATLLGTGTLNAGGQASFITSTLAAGNHSITAVYSGDASFTGSTSPAFLPVVNKAATATTVTAAPNPSVFGQPVTLTATATAVAPGSGTPTGTTSFFDGATLLGTGTLNAAGQASFTTSTLAAGNHSITAVYAGDANFTGSTSPAVSPVVNQAATTTTLASSPNPSAFGQPVTLTATASAVAPGAGTPTGTASFFDGTTLLGTGTLNAAGKATFTTTTLALGTHSITAVYSGDANFTGSTSAVVSPVVNQTATTTTLSSSPNPSVLGETVTLTVMVDAVAPGAGVPTGMVTFTIDGNTVASVALTAPGQAVYNFSTVAIRTYIISATYTGDANFKASTSANLSQNVICASPIFVDAAAGSDGNSGATPALAKKTIQAGVDAACDGGTVILKAGTYQPTASLRVDKSVNIVGAGSGTTKVSGSGNGGTSVFSINASGTNPVPTVLLSDLSIQDGTVSAGGGGIENVHSTLTVSNCAITANQVTATNGLGGGIQNNGSTLTVVNSTISGNQATGSNSFGGGLFNQASTATIVNSTISGNQAGGQGGGIYTDSGSTLTVADSTITGNRGTNAAGGLYVGGAATLDNTIVAGNFSGGGTASSDLGGGIVTNASHDLIGDAGSADGIVDGVNGNIVGNHGSGVLAINAVLNPTLANNGGPTLTHALVPNSLALDHGFSFSEVQQIAVSGNAGTFTLTFNGQTTAALAFNATAAQVQTALNALSSIGGAGGSVLVAASGGSYTVTFGGALAGADQPQIVATSVGGATVSVTTLANGLPPTDQRGPGFPRMVNNTVDIGAVEFAAFVPATTVASINRLSSTPSNQGLVQWTVVFANAVSGVAAANFSLANSGLGGSPAISSVTPVGSAPATSWTVAASTGTGDGTLGLNLDNASGISIQVNGLPFVGQVYTIDRTPPTVTISAPSVTNTASGPVTYTVTYTDANFGSSTLAASNITLNATGTATGTITVSGSNNTRTVTISSISGHGTLGISLAAGTAVDLAGNLAPAAGPSATFIVNQSPVAGPVTVTRLTTAGVTIPVATILAHDSDPDGDVLSVTAVQAPSSGKATATLSGSNVVYTPNPGFSASDSFTYTVSDPLGATATGTVTVNVTNVSLLGRLTIQNLGAGSFQVSGNETPGQVYTVQYATSFAPPNWKTLRTITTDAQGAFSFTDTSTNSSRNYRLAFP